MEKRPFFRAAMAGLGKSGRGNGIKIATTPYHASSLDLASQGRARYGIVAI